MSIARRCDLPAGAALAGRLVAATPGAPAAPKYQAKMAVGGFAGCAL